MSSRNTGGKNIGSSNGTGRRMSGWRLHSSKVVAAFQHDTFAVVVGTPKVATGAVSTTHDTITPRTAVVRDVSVYDSIQKEHEQIIQERIAKTSNEMIIRFLRRSFFQALCDEDLDTAHFCYVATRDDFEKHFITIMRQKFLRHRLQREEEERQRQEGQNRSHLKRKGVIVESPCSVIPSSHTTNTNDVTGSSTGKGSSSIDQDCELSSDYATAVKTKSRSVGLLQQTMDICDSFTLDDYLDPYDDPYRPCEDGEVDITEDRNIEDGTQDVDDVNALFDEILRISTGTTKQKSPIVPVSSSSILTRSSFRRNRQRDLDSNTDGNLSFMNYGSDEAIADGMMGSIQEENTIVVDPSAVTTPIHEVARLGHAELLKCMLQQRHRRRHHKSIDLDVRNGYGRTVLHNAAGGLVAADITALPATSIDVDTGNIVRSVGIGAPQNRMRKDIGNNPDEEAPLSATGDNTPNNDVSVTQRISRMVNRRGRWLSIRNIKSTPSDVMSALEPSVAALQRKNYFGKFSIHDNNGANVPTARIDRMETINIVLSWRSEMTAATELHDSDDEVHTEDEIVTADEKPSSISSFDGAMSGLEGCGYGGSHVSTNAVDEIMNRTALHYAAELGRTDICDAILSSFYGTMLTIVDNSGHTPCELAALNNHKELASYLEARSLLYVDPYGTEEELLSAISFAEMNHDDVAYYRYNLVAPYCCFETISRNDAEKHREMLLQEAIQQIDLHVAEFYKRSHKRRAQKQNGTLSKNDDPPGQVDSTGALDEAVSADDQATTSDDQNAVPLNDYFDIEYDAIGFAQLLGDVTSNSTNESSPSDNISAIYTTGMEIGIHAGHVEKLLSYHKWLVYDMMKALRQDPCVAFKNANVPIPQHLPASPNYSKLDQSTQQNACLICCDEFNAVSGKWKQMNGCDHGFCADCLVDYIAEHTTTSSTGYVIECPHHDCSALMSTTMINDVVQESTDTCDQLRRNAIDAFVVSSYDYTYCPYPGCGETKVIHTLYPKGCYPSNAPALRLIGGVCTNVHNSTSDSKGYNTNESADATVVLTYESIADPRHYDLLDLVQPPLAHRFCFVCGDKQIHWPINCVQLQKWRSAIVEQVGEQNAINQPGASSNYNDVAQNLWMKVNTRPCPKCNAPIQKDEGCNHITCRNPHCKHQFCWICRADWSTHNTATGGNYRCNRWVEQPEHEAYDGQTIFDDETRARLLAVQETDPSLFGNLYGTAGHESRVSRQRSSETARFLHHYERWCGHANSASLEHKMRLNLCKRLAPVVRNAIEYGGGINIFGGKGISFVHSAFSELLECRSMLQHSYAFAFVYYKSSIADRQKSNEKVAFERVQSELELLTEQMSDVVARTHIRASETQILFLTKETSGKRKEFTNVMFGILRTIDIDEKKKLNRNQVNLPGHRPTIVGSGDYTSDGEDTEAAAEAIRQSLDAYDAANDGRFRRTLDDDENEIHDWACPGCTYMNAGSVRRCDMCDTRRMNAGMAFINGE